MRLPPEGARARNRSYYPYSKDPEAAAAKLKNPLPASVEVFQEGEIHYRKFCIYCHGSKGGGKESATVAPKMAVPPPSLLTPKAQGYSDGRIYHIIYNGIGLMGPYRIQLGRDEKAMKEYWGEGRVFRKPKDMGGHSSSPPIAEREGRIAQPKVGKRQTYTV